MFHVKHNIKIDQYLTEGLNQLQIDLSPEVKEKLVTYFQMLLAKNEVLNLISPKQDLKTKVAVHLLDSLSPLLWSDWPAKLIALDIGSGGGFPSIPLAIVNPEWSWTLAESTVKKSVFLKEVAKSLNLGQITVTNQYLEPANNLGDSVYNLVTARAVSDLKKVLPLVASRLASGGYFLAFKGPRASQELSEAAAILKKTKLRLEDQLDFELPLVEARRSLLLLVKD
jgi:16S rRNA (guanine527-N7)-methyltransferase